MCQEGPIFILMSSALPFSLTGASGTAALTAKGMFRTRDGRFGSIRLSRTSGAIGELDEYYDQQDTVL